MTKPNHQIAIAAAALCAALLTACGDARVKKLEAGITRDSVLAILRDGLPVVGADSLPHVYDDAAYLVNGRRYEVLYYTKGDELAKIDTLPPDRLTPIVLQNDTVTGWGWEHWDSVARVIKVPLPERK